MASTIKRACVAILACYGAVTILAEVESCAAPGPTRRAPADPPRESRLSDRPVGAGQYWRQADGTWGPTPPVEKGERGDQPVVVLSLEDARIEAAALVRQSQDIVRQAEGLRETRRRMFSALDAALGARGSFRPVVEAARELVGRFEAIVEEATDAEKRLEAVAGALPASEAAPLRDELQNLRSTSEGWRRQLPEVRAMLAEVESNYAALGGR